MNNLTELKENELVNINGGGLIGAAAGAAAGAIVGGYLSMVSAATGGNSQDVGRWILRGTAIGSLAGLL